MKLQLLVITIMFLCTMKSIASTLKDHKAGRNKNTQKLEELLNLNPTQNQNEQGLQDQPDTFKDQFKNQTSQYNGVSWHKHAKKWEAQLMHNKKKYYGGLFDNEEQAGMKVNLLCKKFEKECKNPMIEIEPEKIQQGPNKTSQYNGVSWQKNAKKWYARLIHNQKQYYGGLFDNEEKAAMKVNLLCDENEIERKNPTIDIKLDIIQQVPNQTSQYNGVSWHKGVKKWEAQLTHNKKKYYGGIFDNEEKAAMKINLLCDKIGIERKNPMIDIKSDVIQEVSNKTSIYNGVCWHRENKKWQVQLIHNKKQYYGGSFDNEEQAAMKINLLCDKMGIDRKNPMIDLKPDAMKQVNKQIKVEDENTLDRFKDKCENHFMQSNHEESCSNTVALKSKKRKRKVEPIMTDVVEEKVEITTPNHDGNEVLGKLQ